MALKATKTSGSGGGDFERCPLGNHPAVCVAVIGAGTHTQSFPGKDSKDEVKVILVWEVEADDEDGNAKRFFILKDFNLYMSEKANLYKLISGWFPTKKIADGDEVDLTKLLKQPCLLTVVESKSGYPQIDAAKPLVKGMKPLPPSVTPLLYDIETGEEYPAPAWVPYIWGRPMQDYLAEAHEYQGDAAEPEAATAAADLEAF